ncbi:hypothetical protein TeGR_g5776 [Tetraparma gracilis]|uniref:Alcohol dehydrogenase iron-type/glycerol dehydrogenase GldA domain-containing protein n=1 Tax=Tetraparma gracilis TaxID=2962635 RepID=A0ABQ6N3C1_9STRA|nr:hypothetical protein TeGR_g5776 [Tetraparma gracilis]
MIFSTTKQLVSFPGASKQLPSLLSALGVSRPLIVTDAGILEAGLLSPLLASLPAASVFADVVPDPTTTNVLSCVEAYLHSGCDGVVGFGGGSSMDVAKVAAYLAVTPTPLEECWGVDMLGRRRAPLVQVPTTAGTGSEVTPVSILTKAGEGGGAGGPVSKAGIVSPTLLPDLAVLDGELTLSLPAATTAHTGVDAMVHAIEAFTCRTKKNPLSDALAKEALVVLHGNIREAVRDGSCVDARSNMLYGSMLAGMAFGNAPVGAVHALAYPLGSIFKGLVDDLGIPRSLGSLGVKEKDLGALCDEGMKQTRLLPNNVRELGREEAAKIYQSIM